MFLIEKIKLYIHFYFKLIINITNNFTKSYRPWKIGKFAESYWFVFNNRKTMHELRYFALI